MFKEEVRTLKKHLPVQLVIRESTGPVAAP